MRMHFVNTGMVVVLTDPKIATSFVVTVAVVGMNHNRNAKLES